ncbi:hypothetical protein [Anaerophaga thermohalophila]|nr:hypothetical protein [Anaerophaga thermohalophila]
MKYKDGEPLNKAKLDSLQRQEYNLYEQNREELEDPEDYMNNPSELIRGF